MLSYQEFIKESSESYYDSFFIKVLSRKSAEEAIKILEKDPTARSFRREYGWEVTDADNKIIKVHLKDPELRSTIERKVKGRHPKIKYIFDGLGDPISDVITTDREKEELKFLAKKHYIDKESADEIYINFVRLFTEKKSNWTKKYASEWEDGIRSIYGETGQKVGVVTDVEMLQLNLDEKEKMVKIGFDIIIKAINNGDLDVSADWFRSLEVVKRYNIF